MAGVVAGQIGSNLFTVFELEPAYYGNMIYAFKRPGTDYHAYKFLGREYPEQELATQQQFSTHAQAFAVAQTYQGYLGTNQTIIRGATSYGTYKIIKLIHGPTPPHRSPIFVGDPGGLTSGWLVQATFRVQRQS